jgi:hypothetical protein
LLMVLRPIAEAARQGSRLFVVMAALSALFILLSLGVSQASPSLAPSPSQLGKLPSASYSVYQILVHVVTGFAAGALSLNPAVALVGAATGPLADLDHLGFFSGLPVEARVAHSVFFVALLVLVEWRTHFWAAGTRNFFLFITLQYSVHFAVAPPGFPLFAPLSTYVVYFPRIEPAAIAAVLAVLFLSDCLKRRRAGPRS